jgi:archaeal type IV pilus assembly protein PilA
MKRLPSDNAVSPVVGVMLMLVVTIIIAAVVSAFAGSLSTAEDKTPQVSITADYSIADGMVITHNGGDTLTVGDFRILLTPSRNFASIESDAYVNEIDQLLISNGPGTSATPWYLAGNGRRMVNRFAAGESAYINASNCDTRKLTPNLYVNGRNNGINQAQYIGATFFLDFVTKDGKRITRIEVPIKP